jgi:hypothetical protein
LVSDFRGRGGPVTGTVRFESLSHAPKPSKTKTPILAYAIPTTLPQQHDYAGNP